MLIRCHRRCFVFQKSVFLSPEGQKFLNHLLNNFPYCQTGGRVKKGQSLKILEQNSDPKCSQENLLICFLYLSLHVGHTNKNLRKEMKTIAEYLSSKFIVLVDDFES